MSVPKAALGAMLSGDIQTVRAMVINFQEKKKRLLPATTTTTTSSAATSTITTTTADSEVMKLRQVASQLTDKAMPVLDMLLTDFDNSFTHDDLTDTFRHLVFDFFPRERLRNGSPVKIADIRLRDRLAARLVAQIDIMSLLREYEVVTDHATIDVDDEADGDKQLVINDLNRLICELFKSAVSAGDALPPKGCVYSQTLITILLDARVAEMLPSLMLQRGSRQQTINSWIADLKLAEVTA